MHKEESEKYHFNMQWIKFIPLMILVGIVPLIVRLVYVAIEDPEAIVFWNATQTSDLFSQFKASLIYFLVGIMLIAFFLIFNKKDIKQNSYLKIAYISMGVYSVFTLLSMMMSSYNQTAMWGMFDRAEGGVMLISYILIMFYSLYVIKDVKDSKYIINTMIVVSVIIAVLGFYQYIGRDLLINTEWGTKLIIPEKYKELRSSIQSLYTERRAYGTLFHYNYVGSFTAMMIPMFMTLMLFVKSMKQKVIYGIGAISSILLLFFSTSRAGIVAVGVTIIVFLILTCRILWRRWKITLPIIIIAVGSIIGLNSITHGQLFERIPSLVQDAFGLFLPGDKSFDYKEVLPLQNIIHDDKGATVQVKGHELRIEVIEGELYFVDETGTTIATDKVEDTYTLIDDRFSHLTFTKVDNGQGGRIYWRMETPMGKLLFQGDTAQSFHLVDHLTLEPIELEMAESYGFQGKERIGSARGYIWSRSLPVLKDHLLLGVGPDCFVFAFPQQDYLGKMYAYETASMIVDKPHNLYLQIGINQGGIALIAFVMMIGAYLVQSIKLYALKNYYQERYAVGMALMLAIVGYLVAGVFNDSVVSVAPIFWVLLGVGMAINYLNMKVDKKERSTLPHATIDMKKRKHI